MAGKEKNWANFKGFREFCPKNYANISYLFHKFELVAKRYCFERYDVPTVEPLELYQKKSGEELETQIYNFQDKKGRNMVLRPELTPSLARLASRIFFDYKMPIKWYQIGSFFRGENVQKGRMREFFQFNCDILGDTSIYVELELISLAIDVMREFGFEKKDFAVCLSSRSLWDDFLGEKKDKAPAFFNILDKWEKLPKEKLKEACEKLGFSFDDILNRIDGKISLDENSNLSQILKLLENKGYSDFVKIDPSIVRGLNYYTGLVFEIKAFSKNNMRAVAGGGRYDKLCSILNITNKEKNIPACGFAIGDVVLLDFIREHSVAKKSLENYVNRVRNNRVYVIIEEEDKRPEAIVVTQKLRDLGLEADFCLSKSKVSKQYAMLEQENARYALHVGRNYPNIKLKDTLLKKESIHTLDENTSLQEIF